MEESVISVIQGILDSRSVFLESTLPIFSRDVAPQIYNRFMINEMCLLELTNRVFQSETRNRQTNHVLTVPITIMENNAGFQEPVVVRPTADQIRNATQAVEQVPANSTCAICQEDIAVNGIKILHCDHLYHESCLQNWFSLSVRCPVCRHDIREVDRVVETSPDEEEMSSRHSDQSEEP